MAISLATVIRNNMMDQIAAGVDAGAGPGVITIYDGTRPASPQTAVSGQTILAEMVFSDPSFSPTVLGTLTANAVNNDSSANADGTATWFRVTDSNGAVVMDGDVATSNSDLNIDSTSISTGVTVSITSFVLNDSNA